MGATGSKPVHMTNLAGSTWGDPNLLLSDESSSRTSGKNSSSNEDDEEEDNHFVLTKIIRSKRGFLKPHSNSTINLKL
jgi:hypothetical protein